MSVQEGLDLGELGMADAIAAATTGYQDHTKVITAAIVQAAATRRFFCADDVRDLLPAATREWLALSHRGPDGRTKSNGNVLGALINAAARAQLITRAGTTIPRRKTRHGNRNTLWRKA